MKPNPVCWTVLILASVILPIVGCHIPDVRNSQAGYTDNHDRLLNDSQVADVQLTLARSLEGRGETESAINAYRQAIEKDPRRASGYWRMAILQDRQGRIEESETLYKEALKRDSKNPDLLSDYGYSLYLQRRWAESEKCLRQAIALTPRHERAHNHLGLLFAQTEQPEAALSEFRLAGCDVSASRSNLAFVMTLNHRWGEAREQYELALDANPESKTAKSGLENLSVVVAKASTGADSVELANYERYAKSPPTKSARKTASKTSAVTSNSSGHATISMTSHED